VVLKWFDKGVALLDTRHKTFHFWTLSPVVEAAGRCLPCFPVGGSVDCALALGRDVIGEKSRVMLTQVAAAV
jgi:hypothetical protein